MYFQNQSWLSVWECYKKVFEPDSNPKNSPEGSKKAPIVVEFKQKMRLYFQNQNLFYLLWGPKNAFEPDFKPKNLQKKKKGKKEPKWDIRNKKIGSYFWIESWQ